MSYIVTHSLFKTYKHPQGDVNVLSDISLKFDQGSSVAITGESGCGKTTLLYLLSGLDNPSSGTIYINKKNITSLSENELSVLRAETFGFIFQHHFLLPDLTALENAILPLRITRKLTPKTLEWIDYLFSELHIDHRKNHIPDELSGGEKQRISVIRALANNPTIIFADEPTGSLDKKNAEQLETLMFKLVQKEKTTLILSTHNINFANRCDFVKSLDKSDKSISS